LKYYNIFISNIQIFDKFSNLLDLILKSFLTVSFAFFIIFFSFAEPHHSYAALTFGKNFDVALVALAPAPTLLIERQKNLRNKS
jgi:hypothetical protein